jgi:hypothetical protein
MPLDKVSATDLLEYGNFQAFALEELGRLVRIKEGEKTELPG